MKRICRWSAALLSLTAFAAAATAQNTAPEKREDPQAVKAADSAMNEDVEILRRLLDQALMKEYGLPAGKNDGVHSYGPVRYYPLIGSAQLSDEGSLLSATRGADAAHVEGVYLKGFGVVYTATLPPPGFDPVGGTNAGAGDKAPLDPWERTRKELRGEAPEPEGKSVPAHRPLSEVILKVLAENGKHFGALGDGERLTAAVTFRGAANCANCHQNMFGNGSGIPPSYQYVTTPSPRPPGAMPPPGGATTPSPNDPNRAPGVAWMTDVRNDILLGDLHLKQGKASEAVAAYKEAIAKLAKALGDKEDGKKEYDPGDLPFLLTAVDLFNKTAQACVAAGDDITARDMLQTAGHVAKEAEKLTGAATASPRAAALPAKLVVTASRKLLDDVGAGKMSFEEFCKAATVEYTGETADKK